MHRNELQSNIRIVLLCIVQTLYIHLCHFIWLQVVDARSSARFKGEVPEPRPSLPSGGMKGAMNLHYSSLLDADLGTFKTKAELAEGVLYMCKLHNNYYTVH